MNTSLKLGSLFDGSGTAPLAAAMCGIEPVWASEIEAFPIRVTSKRFPQMKHLGSITDISGAAVEPVDIICGGSPCQDLSIAGKQVGIRNGERSQLFFEMTRIIREMRGVSNGKYPRYVIWENVPGAFSSNKGRDFLAVLQAFAEIADPDVYVPEPESRGGRLAWKYAGEMVGDGWSIAWRTVDAQYWGVPQRRRRIYLVLDLGSECVGKVLFEREGVRGHLAQSGETWQGTAADAERGFGADDREKVYGWPIGFQPENTRLYEETATTLCNGTRPGYTCGIIERMAYRKGARPHSAAEAQKYEEAEVANTLNAFDLGESRANELIVERRVAAVYESHPMDSRVKEIENVSPTVSFKWHKGAADTPLVCIVDAAKDNATCFAPNGNHCGAYEDAQISATLQTRYHYGSGGDAAIVIHDALCIGNGQLHSMSMNTVCNTLDCMHDQQAVLIDGLSPRRYFVRRLTPLECCRLQGFPDWWIDGCEKYPVDQAWVDSGAMRFIDPSGEIVGSDSAKYKLWGNGMALPNMLFVMQGIVEVK